MYSNFSKNYSHIEKEGLVIIFTIKKFHILEHERKFILQTDHKPLLNTPTHTVNKLQQILIDFDLNFRTYILKMDHADSWEKFDINQNKLTKVVVILMIKLESEARKYTMSHCEILPIKEIKWPKCFHQSNHWISHNYTQFQMDKWKGF